MQTKTRTAKWLVALVFLSATCTKLASSQSCVDDDGDGWGWDSKTNTSCRVGNPPPGNAMTGGLKVTWAANDASEKVDEYELVSDINGGNQTTLFRGNDTTFTVRLAGISANYKDFVCVRIRAVRLGSTTATGDETYSDWSVPACITLPDAPLQAPQMIELSLIE